MTKIICGRIDCVHNKKTGYYKGECKKTEISLSHWKIKGMTDCDSFQRKNTNKKQTI